MPSFQLHVDRQPCAPRRATQIEAAIDALETGFARPDRFGRIVLDEAADIKKIPKKLDS